MPGALIEFYDNTSIIDLLYLVTTIFSLIKCYKKGFVLSILSMAKWLLAYIITLLIFPRVKPYLKDIIDNEYVLDVGLGVSIFIFVISKFVGWKFLAPLSNFIFFNSFKTLTIIVEGLFALWG